MSIAKVPQILQETFKPEVLDGFIDLINGAMDNQKGEIIELVEQRFETRLSREIGALRVEMQEQNASLRTEMYEQNASLRTEIQTARADTIKWMFLFWIGQVGVVSGLLFYLFSRI